MIEPKDITKMVKHIVRRDNGMPDSNIMHPMREWALGLSVVGLLVVGGAGFAVVVYRNYDAALVAEVPVVTATIPYKAGIVTGAITQYEAERATYESLVGRPVAPSQPAATATPIVEASSTIETATATTTPDIVPETPAVEPPVPSVSEAPVLQ